MLVLAIVFAVLSLTHGAPQMRRHRRHRHWSSVMTEDRDTPQWNNSCGSKFAFEKSNPLINNMKRIRAVSIHFVSFQFSIFIFHNLANGGEFGQSYTRNIRKKIF